MKIFIGYDPRQRLSYHVLAQSLIEHASLPLAITALRIQQLPLSRQGLTPFTWSRFLVPWLTNFNGWSLFLDSDMVVTGDIVTLLEEADESKAVMIRADAQMPQFERASLMLFNGAHPANHVLTPANIENGKLDNLHSIGWLKPEEIGALPATWNYCVGYEPVPRDIPKLVHYTQGNPLWPETVDCDLSDVWLEEFNRMRKAASWQDLMGRSVHAKHVMARLKAQRETKPEPVA